MIPETIAGRISATASLSFLKWRIVAARVLFVVQIASDNSLQD